MWMYVDIAHISTHIWKCGNLKKLLKAFLDYKLNANSIKDFLKLKIELEQSLLEQRQPMIGLRELLCIKKATYYVDKYVCTYADRYTYIYASFQSGNLFKVKNPSCQNELSRLDIDCKSTLKQ